MYGRVCWYMRGCVDVWAGVLILNGYASTSRCACICSSLRRRRGSLSPRWPRIRIKQRGGSGECSGSGSGRGVVVGVRGVGVRGYQCERVQVRVGVSGCCDGVLE